MRYNITYNTDLEGRTIAQIEEKADALAFVQMKEAGHDPHDGEKHYCFYEVYDTAAGEDPELWQLLYTSSWLKIGI